jgi:preprotein translocase subunit YajC
LTIGTIPALVALQVPPAGGRTGTVLLIYMVAFGMIMWFLIIRPQRRMQQKHQEMLKTLKKGDEVVTDGGIIGQVVHLAEDRVTVKTAESTRVVVARSKIARVVSAPGEQS